jgi:hypothetical protein
MTATLCWINVGPEGRFRQSGAISSKPADVDHLLGAGMADRARLILHFHGGLVPESSGKAIAEAMAAHYGDTAASIAMVWETGILEVFRDNLKKIHKTRVFRKALSWVLAKAAPRLGLDEGAKGAAGQALDAQAIESMLESEAGVALLDSALAEAARVSNSEAVAKGGAGEESLLEETIALDLELDFYSDPELVELIESDTGGAGPIRKNLELNAGEKSLSVMGIAWFVAKVVVAVIRRYRNGTHHDPVPTAVEELLRAAYMGEVGQFAWGEMKRKALDMWIDDGPLPGEEGHVGGYVLRRLEKLAQDRPEVTIDLVGHSAGSIAICHMLAEIEAQGRAIPIRNIAFLAPAVRLDFFAQRIVRHAPQFKRFRAFTMCDEAEKSDKLVGAVYPRSLLFFISGLLEARPGTPLAGLARHVTARTASAGAGYDDVHKWLGAGDRLILAPTPDSAADGLRTRSAHHGDFDNDNPTLASLLFMAQMQP